MATKTTYYYRDGKWVSKEELYGSNAPAPMVHVITDSMETLQHPCNGQFYSSKSTFRKVTRAHNCTETGDEAKAENTHAIPDCPGRREELVKVMKEMKLL